MKFKKIFAVLFFIAVIVISVSIYYTLNIHTYENKIILNSDDMTISLIKTNNQEMIEKDLKLKPYLDESYVNWGSLFYFDDEEIDDPKYASVTPDGKIKWDTNKDIIFNEDYIKKDIEKLITIDRKNLKFPINFKDFNNEYSLFDKIDWKKLEKYYNDINTVLNKKYSILKIQDKKNGYILSVTQIMENGAKICYLSNNNQQYIATVVLNNNNHITSISNNVDIGKTDIKVDGIGIGSTLNELYSKLGTPSSIKYEKNKNIFKIIYNYNSNKKNQISFTVPIDVNAEFSKEKGYKMFPNTILGVYYLSDNF